MLAETQNVLDKSTICPEYDTGIMYNYSNMTPTDEEDNKDKHTYPEITQCTKFRYTYPLNRNLLFLFLCETAMAYPDYCRIITGGGGLWTKYTKVQKRTLGVTPNILLGGVIQLEI